MNRFYKSLPLSSLSLSSSSSSSLLVKSNVVVSSITCPYNYTSLRLFSIIPSSSLSSSSLSSSSSSSPPSSLYNYTSIRCMSKMHKKWNPPKKPTTPYPDFPVHDREIDAELDKIDTTLTPDQTKYVEMLKKQIRGGVNSPRSIYREVPKSEEIEGEGNFMPKMAPNAEKLIDYALSFIPKRTGPRRSRHKKRMLARQNQRVANDARRIIQTRKSKEAKLEKSRKARELTKKYKAIVDAQKAPKIDIVGQN